MSTRYKKKRYAPKKKNDQTVRKIARKEVKAVMHKELETKNFFGRQNPVLNPQSTGITIPILYDAAGAIYMTQGSSRNQYIGDTIDPMYLRVNYLCTAAIPAGSYYTYRVLILQTKGGGTPSPVNVLASTGNVMTPYSDFDPTYRDTYTVLYDKKHLINEKWGNAVTQTAYIKAKRMRKINFVGATAASISANGLWMIVFTDSSTVNPLFGYQLSFGFKDA